MATPAEIQGRINAANAAVEALGVDALATADALEDSEAVRLQQQTQIATLQQQLADCQDNEPDPEPEDPSVPKGEFWWGDNMTLTSEQAIRSTTEFGNPDKVGWGQYSGPGAVGSRVVLRDDGPVVNGVRQKCRRITCNNGDRDEREGDTDNERVEIGQVNDTDGCVFPVDSEFIIWQWYRIPTNLVWGTGGAGGGESGSLCQMKHSSKAEYGGAGGNPSSSGPPLHLKQDKDGIFVDAKPTGTGTVVYRRPVPHLQWWEIGYHVHFSLSGFVAIYYRPEGQPRQLVLPKRNIGTIKRNTQGNPMFSTYRVGVYQSNPAPARFVDVSLARAERIR